MQPPYPVALVPLLPQFLTRRRTKLDYVLRTTEELGLDRPAFVRAVSLGEAAPDGATLEELLFPYSVRAEMMRGMLAAGEAAGLVEERDGRFHATEKARDHGRRFHSAARAHLETIQPLPQAQLTRLADLLERVFLAAAAAAPAAPHAHTPRAFRYREGSASEHPLVALDNAIYGLWMVRDDCHVAAWTARRLSGPDLNVLTQLWRGEAETTAGLAALLGSGTEDHIDASLTALREAGLVEGSGPLRPTARGRSERDAIEMDTDRAFFGPWPDDVGSEADWITDHLAQVNAALE